MGKIGRFFKVTTGAMCVIFAFTFAVLIISEHKPEMVAGAVLFAVLAYFLLRPKKTKTVKAPRPAPPQARAQASSYALEAPEETLREMRQYYGAEQAQNDARIMQESLQLIQQTTNFDTFISRLGLVQRSALTLLQAEKAGCRGVQPGTREACEKALDAVKSAKVSFLYASYIKETNEALRLKTPAGKRKRLEAYLSKLREHKTDFADVEEAYKKAVYDTETLLPK